MNSWLLFLFKSTLVLSLLYLFFSLIMRRETFFRGNRLVLLLIVFASLAIPLINISQLYHPAASVIIDPVFQDNTIEKTSQINEAPSSTYPSITDSNTKHPMNISTVIIFIYLTGVIVSFSLFLYSIFSVYRLFNKSQKASFNGVKVMIINSDIPAFSFLHRILISRHDYDTNSQAILTHELSHIRKGHFYDLMLMEIIKIIYWFNPLIYKLVRDIKDVHEFQADEQTLNSGLDPIEYQLLIIKDCVGHQMFALANNFNHCQIKKRITMMNKSKTTKEWRWKVATFLPLLALLLMAFGRMGATIKQDSSMPVADIAPTKFIQKQNEKFKRKIEIRKDGNYIDNQLYSLQEIAEKGQEWYSTSNDWIFLSVDESIPLNRIDEVRGALNRNYWIIQSTVNSDDLVYFAGDVSDAARFNQGNFNDWFNSQLDNYLEDIYKNRKYEISFSFIIGKNGKVRDGHIVKESDYPEINAAYEKILAQIPDWEPAKRGTTNVSVYKHLIRGTQS